jgi:hypothetical protein
MITLRCKVEVCTVTCLEAVGQLIHLTIVLKDEGAHLIFTCEKVAHLLYRSRAVPLARSARPSWWIGVLDENNVAHR